MNAETDKILISLRKILSCGAAIHLPDPTAAGGDKRGSHCVDFQTSRSDQNQVASGANSVIVGGYHNRASGGYSACLGGSTNWASGSYSFAMGLNTKAEGDASTASGYFAIATGYLSTTRGIYCATARAAGRFSANGDCQAAGYILRTATADGNEKELCADGGTGSATTRIVLPDNTAYKFRAQVIARNTSNGDTKAWDITGAIKRGSGVGTTTTTFNALSGVVVTVLAADAGAAAWTIVADADTANGSLRLKATGAAATAIHWGASIDTFELG